MNQYSEEKIDFRKCRDLGELITVTFRFARQEGKSLLKPVFMYLAPILLVFLICLDSLYVFVFGGDKALYGEGIDQFLWMNLLNSFIAILINLLVNFFTYSYIYSYIKGNGRVDFSLVKERMFRRFFPALGWIMIAGITIIFGLFFFIIPAIYFSIMFTLLLPVLFLEEPGESTPFGRCHALIKNKWWFTFGLSIVFGLILYAFYIGFYLPFLLVLTLLGMTSADQHFIMLATLVFRDIITVAAIVFQVFYAILMAFHYNNLIEAQELPGLMARINNILEPETSKGYGE